MTKEIIQVYSLYAYSRKKKVTLGKKGDCRTFGLRSRRYKGGRGRVARGIIRCSGKVRPGEEIAADFAGFWEEKRGGPPFSRNLREKRRRGCIKIAREKGGGGSRWHSILLKGPMPWEGVDQKGGGRARWLYEEKGGRGEGGNFVRRERSMKVIRGGGSGLNCS